MIVQELLDPAPDPERMDFPHSSGWCQLCVREWVIVYPLDSPDDWFDLDLDYRMAHRMLCPACRDLPAHD